MMMAGRTLFSAMLLLGLAMPIYADQVDDMFKELEAGDAAVQPTDDQLFEELEDDSAADDLFDELSAEQPSDGEPAADAADVEQSAWNRFSLGDFDFQFHGFWEARGGYRTRNDPYQKDLSILETRLQLDLSGMSESASVRFKADTWADRVTNDTHFQIRESNISMTPLDNVDIKFGRQILTWGTGDLIFINDLFPKDYQSFISGRDDDYLKAPSDAVKVSIFGEAANIDVVYTPQFDRDVFISGRRLSYFSDSLGRFAGRDAVIHTDTPDRWFEDDEIAIRIYKNIDNYELALYGYRGFWKSPAGQSFAGQATFPDLNVYGASIRGNIGKGIGNLEFGYYESADDRSGRDPLTANSQMRFLAGYKQELAADFTVGLQYYLEYMTEYDRYRDSYAGSHPARRDAHYTSLRLTKLLMNQNLQLGMFAYYSPSHAAGYLRPNIYYKLSDNMAWELGAMIFYGENDHSPWSQLKNNSNIYTAIRYFF